MRSIRHLVLANAIVATLSINATAQELTVPSNSNMPEWAQLMYQDNPDPGAVVAAYRAYYSRHAFQKNEHTQHYKRWIRALHREPNPNLNSPTRNAELKAAEQSYLTRSAELRALRDPGSQWQPLGPFDFDKYAESRSYAAGAAHVYTVEQSATNSDVLYAGTATAGIWKSVDKGENWTLVTADMMINGSKSIEIDHADDDVVYFGAAGTIYKTTDGGGTWSDVADGTLSAESHDVKDLVMHPANSNVVWACTNHGLYRTSDAGGSWTQVLTGEAQELEFHPSNDSILYVIRYQSDTTEFWKSVDAGTNWYAVPDAWTAPDIANDEHQRRTEIAVTPAAPNNVYALATGKANGGSGLYGIYFSSDAGETWEFRCCGAQPSGPADPATNPNLTGWQDDASDDGGQYYYDLALDVSSTDPDLVHVGAVNHWVSTDGGYTFLCPAKWSHAGKKEYVHADIHDIRYYGNDLWFACDGGIFYSDNAGDSIARKMYGIQGTDFWGFGTGFQDGQVMLGGTYHNGTLLKDNDVYENGWISTNGGDNIRGFVNPGNSRWVYHDGEGRVLSGDRLAPLTNFQFDSMPNASYIVGESSDMRFDPTSPYIVYTGRHKNLIRTTDHGETWEVLHTFGDKVASFDIGWSNPMVMYVCLWPDWWGTKSVWRTNDGGVNWTEITPPSSMLDGNEWVPYDVAVDSENEDFVWLARTSQYGNSPDLDGNQIYFSDDGGDTWQDYSSSTLDGEYITDIVHQRGTQGGVYVGTRRAVYYRNESMTDWALFNNGLPVSTNCTRLVPHYGAGKLRNGTNRSAYEVDFYEVGQPQAQISADKFTVDCFDNTIQFFDRSAATGNVTWSWSFPGGTPASSSDRNPLVAYQQAGQYDVSLTVTDDQGTDTQSYTAFVTVVEGAEDVDLAEDFEAGAFQETWRLENAAGTFNWSITQLDNGIDCAPTTAAMAEHFSINQAGTEAELITPLLSLSSVGSPVLEFDYAYAEYGGQYSDGFRVDVSRDCGFTWDSIWGASGDDLQTVPDTNEWWAPGDCADWASKSFDLSNYYNDTIMVRFVAINGWGNNFFLDNVNISGAAAIQDGVADHGVQLFPNPNSGSFTLLAEQAGTAQVIDVTGAVIQQLRLIQGVKHQIEVGGNPGIYLVRCHMGDHIVVKQVAVVK